MTHKLMKTQWQELIKNYPKGPIHLLLSGHGSLDQDGVYQIKKEGSKQADVEGFGMVYEGEENKLIKQAILERGERVNDMKLVDLNPWAEDTGLNKRAELVREQNDIWKPEGYLPLLWELHLNAFNGKAKGTEIYTTRGDNLSDDIATIWWGEAQRILTKEDPDHKWRPDNADGDPDKEMDFAVIKKSPAYGVLIEFYFFDNPEEVKRYMNEWGRNLWADTCLSAMNNINNMWGLGGPALH